MSCGSRPSEVTGRTWRRRSTSASRLASHLSNNSQYHSYGLQTSQRRAEMQASQLRARGIFQKFELPPYQGTTPSQPIPFTDDQDASSSRLSISAILNGPASATTTSEQNPSGAISATEGCTETVLQHSRSILSPRSSSRATRIQRAAKQGDINANLPILPESDQTYTTKQRPLVSSEVLQLPTPPAQPQEQYYESLYTSWPSTDHNGTAQASVNTPLLQSESPSISTYLDNPTSRQTLPTSILYGNINQPSGTGLTPSQASLEAPGGLYNAAVAQSQQNSFRSSSVYEPSDVAIVKKSGRESDADVCARYVVPIDVHQASRLADEKRARNAGASARFRSRRKEREKEAKDANKKLQLQVTELKKINKEVEEERDFYRDVVLKTSGWEHHAKWRPPKTRSIRSPFLQRPMHQMTDPQAPQEAEFHADPSLERAQKRRRTNTESGYSSAEQLLPPVTTHTPVVLGFPPKSTLPRQKDRSEYSLASDE